MTIEEIRLIARKLAGVTEDIKWEDHLCFNVGGKMFLVTAPDQVPPSASIKVSDEAFRDLPAREGIIPAPYLARHQWVFLDDINRFTRKEWERYIPEAHRLVAARLSAKAQAQLGLQHAPAPIRKARKTAKKKAAKKVAKKRSSRR